MMMIDKDIIEVRVVAKTATNPAQIGIRYREDAKDVGVRLIAAPNKHTVAAYSKDCRLDPSGTIRPVLSGRIGWVWERNDAG